MPTTSNILGVEELKKSFSDLSVNLKKRVIRDGLRKAITIVSDAIVPATPEHLGILKASAETKISVSSNGQMGRATFGYGSQSRIALLVEYGHLEVGHQPGLKELGVAPPKPWILPNLDRVLPEAMQVFDEAVETSVINFERAT